jgi:hypothetical protein
MIFLLAVSICCSSAIAQPLSQVKKELETTPDPIGYVKFKMKKKFKIDTVAVLSTSSFMGKADSLAYRGKVGKVYGPFKNENILVKILMKAPNTFYHVSHILIDTSTFSKNIADSLASALMARQRQALCDEWRRFGMVCKGCFIARNGCKSCQRQKR